MTETTEERTMITETPADALLERLRADLAELLTTPYAEMGGPGRLDDRALDTFVAGVGELSGLIARAYWQCGFITADDRDEFYEDYCTQWEKYGRHNGECPPWVDEDEWEAIKARVEPW